MLTKMKGTMKSTFRLFLVLLLPLLLWTGCGMEPVPQETRIPDHCIEITLGGLHPSLSTKASSRGSDAYNENLVKSVDCFFYPNGASSSDAVFMALGRGAEAVAEGDSTVYKVKVFFTDADANRIFGNTVSGTCQLYVICNAPLSYSGHTDVSTLKGLVVENDFTAQPVQASFVMSADELATVTLETHNVNGEDVRTASGRIKVSRSAAKIQFFLNIPDEFEDESHQIWEPALDAGVSIDLSNAVKRGKVDGDYSVQTSDYISYGSRVVTVLNEGDLITGHENYKYSHIPFYSYPCAWSDLSDYATTVVFRIAWRIQGESGYQWKKYQLSPNISTLDLKRNTSYRTFVNVQSLGGADKESLVIIPECDYEILPWMNEGASGGGQGVVPGELITYKYLVMDHPNQTINNETTVYFSYVTSSHISSITIKKVDYIVNTNTTPFQTQTLNRTVTDDRETISTYAGNITVNKENPGYITIQHPLDDMYSSITVYATVTNDDGCIQDIKFVQNPSIRLLCDYTDVKGDAFVDGYFCRVVNATFGTQYTENTEYWKGTYKSYNNTTTGNDITLPGDYAAYGTVGFARRSNENPVFTTEVNVTSFNINNNTFTVNLDGTPLTREYFIGDPRMKASERFPSWSLLPYLSGANTHGDWENPGDILIAFTAPENQNYIAPRFLVSSNCNAQSTKPTSFENAVKRAAVYQEAGYPAGRWRLPTEAEVAFIYARQKDGCIPDKLYTNTSSSGYYAASGRRVTVASSTSTVVNLESTFSGNPSSRFVYDLWYWGDEQSTTNVYHPNGHIYNYDAAGNATLIR